MKICNRFITLLCIGGFSLGLSAQTLKDAQQLFSQKKYTEAKPVFKKYVMQSPSNGNLNYWYGVCLYETGEAESSIEYLRKGAERKVINAQLFLAKACMHTYRFDEAVEQLEKYIEALHKRKEDTTPFEALLERTRRQSGLLRGVEKITVIDSFVVDKEQFLSAYKLSKESGKVAMGEKGGTTFTNEMEDKKILSLPADSSHYGLYSSIRLIKDWSDPEPLHIPSIKGNLNYPFVNSDGITLYFASDSPEGIGGYDLYVTRQSGEGNSYLKPDNLGFPFNSPYNDYLYAIDDFHNLGWFASDRFQPQGKVCIYVFVPNEQKVVYDYDATAPATLIRLAALQGIKMTQQDADKLRLARQRLANVRFAVDETTRKKADFTFIVNDKAVYHTQDDFQSEEARKTFQIYAQKQKDLRQLEEDAATLRSEYMKADKNQKNTYIPRIEELEKRIKVLYLETEQLKLSVIRTENKTINP